VPRLWSRPNRGPDLFGSNSRFTEGFYIPTLGLRTNASSRSSSFRTRIPTEFTEGHCSHRGFRGSHGLWIAIGREISPASDQDSLEGENRQLDFLTDEDGRFHGIVKPGKYAFTAEFPAGYEADYLPPVVTTIEHHCTQVSVAARSTASITAHIVDVDGDVLGLMSVQLTLETAEDQQFVQSVWPDEKSNLHADNLLPGRYILGLNTYLPVSWSMPHYFPTYFPGVSRRSDAQVITLSAGEHKILSEMRIKKGKECEIPVVVIDSLGRASPSAIVALAYPDYPHFYFPPRQQTDPPLKDRRV
jgi:hypothetical protein